MKGQGSVYLIHLSSKMSHAQHYIGWAAHLEKRVAHHRHGTGARMLAAAAERGITFDVVRTWEGDRTLERRLKNYKKSRLLCPVCSGQLAYKRMR